MAKLEIREEACRGCEMCVDICPVDVMEYDSAGQKAKVKDQDFCIACLSCKYLCPSSAITVSDYHVVKNFYRNLTFSRRMELYL